MHAFVIHMVWIRNRKLAASWEETMPLLQAESRMGIQEVAYKPLVRGLGRYTYPCCTTRITSASRSV